MSLRTLMMAPLLALVACGGDSTLPDAEPSGDEQATPILRDRTPRTIADGVDLQVRQMHRREDDLVVLYGFDVESDSP